MFERLNLSFRTLPNIFRRSKGRMMKSVEDLLESSMPLEAMLQVVQEKRRRKRKSRIPKDLDRPTLRAGFPYANEQLSPLRRHMTKSEIRAMDRRWAKADGSQAQSLGRIACNRLVRQVYPLLTQVKRPLTSSFPLIQFSLTRSHLLRQATA